VYLVVQNTGYKVPSTVFSIYSGFYLPVAQERSSFLPSLVWELVHVSQAGVWAHVYPGMSTCIQERTLVRVERIWKYVCISTSILQIWGWKGNRYTLFLNLRFYCVRANFFLTTHQDFLFSATKRSYSDATRFDLF